MSSRNLFAAARAVALVLFLALSGFGGTCSPAAALTAAATVRDANSIQLGDVTYRLDGVDAPELDQVCIDDHADPWTCGIDARDQLTKLIGGKQVRCEDVGPEKNFGKRHRAICTVEGDKVTLNEQLVRLGFAIAREPLKANVKPAAAEAKTASSGIWKGCFGFGDRCPSWRKICIQFDERLLISRYIIFCINRIDWTLWHADCAIDAFIWIDH